MKALPPQRSIDRAWIEALAAALNERDGRLLHVVLTVEHPDAPNSRLVALNDELLVPVQHSVSTVASTLFPSSTYADPLISYEPDMPAEKLAKLDSAAEDLYERYRQMLPTIQTFAGNSHGTYFGRLVSWPGKEGDGYNQLAVRVRQLRGHRKARKKIANAADLVLEGSAEVETQREDDSTATGGAGLQVYKSTDERQQAFPCLVHIDISVIRDELNILAVYRHWHMITKAYGNLIGLTRLQHFLAQQAGYRVGELMVHGTVANAQVDTFRRARLQSLVEQGTTLLDEVER